MLLLPAAPAEAASFWSPRQNDLIYVEMTGQVARGDYFWSSQMVARRSPRTAKRIVLSISSPGGRVDGMWEMIFGIERTQRQLPVQIVVRDRCESACADIFLAADERYMEPAGVLGFHAAAFHGRELADDIRRSVAYYRQRGVPPMSAIQFATTPHRTMRFVTADQAAQLGIARMLTRTPSRPTARGRRG
jgi:membrane-bound ClpP family serine protease